jgi:hypothetical protein
LKAALAQQQLGDAAAQAGVKAGAAADSWIKLNVGFGQVLTSVREQIAAQEKAVIAREAEGKASVALAAAFGTEAEKRDAQAQAATANAQAMQQLAQLRQTELATMQAQLAALKEEAAEHGKLSNERTKQLAELEKQIGLRQQDADKAIAQAQAARLVAEQAKAQAEALRDNSARVDELRETWERARAEVERVRAAQAAGKATLEQVTQAELAAGRAALLYRDAISDQLKSIKAKADAQRASVDLEAASVQLAMAQQRAVYELARARGDEAGAIRAANELRKLEIQLAELSAKAKRAEGEAALAIVAAKRAELIASDQLTEVKRLELDAAEKAARVKIKEAEIAEATAKGLKDLADAHRMLAHQAGGGARSGLESVTSALEHQRMALADQSDAMAKLMMSYTMSANYSERQIALLEREAAAAEKVAEAYRKKWNIDKDGFTLDSNGQRMQQSAPSERYVYDTAKAQGLTDEQALALLEEFMPNGKASRGNNGNTGLGASKDWFTLVNEAINRAVIEAARNRVNGTGPAAPPAPTTTTTTSSGSSGQRERGSSGGVTLQINLHPGVDLSNRAEAERMARQLMPAIENLNRRGMRVR